MCGPSYWMYILYMHIQNIRTYVHIHLQYTDYKTRMNSYYQVNLHGPVSQHRGLEWCRV